MSSGRNCQRYSSRRHRFSHKQGRGKMARGVQMSGSNNMRGRPKMQMTLRRRQVLEAFEAEAREGVCPSLSRLARRCGLYDYRDARRVISDLRAMGQI